MLVQEITNCTKKVKKSETGFHYADCYVNGSSFQADAPDYLASRSNKENKVAKSYEVVGKAISESYFETSYNDEDVDFVNDYAQNYKKGIILIMTDIMDEEEINFFTKNMKDKIKYIIYYKGEPCRLNIEHSRGLTFIRTFSLRAAVNQAYKKAKNGQAIILPKVDSNFDFCRYIETYN